MITSLNSGLATVIYTGDGSTVNYPFNFPLLASSEVVVIVSLNGVDVTESFTNTVNQDTFNVVFVTAPTSEHTVIIKRKTNLEERAVDFVSGAVLRDKDLDADSLQAFYALQELTDIESSLQGVNVNIDDQVEAVNTAIASINATATELETSLAGIQTTVDGVDARIDTLESFQTAATTEFSDITDQFATQGASITNINGINTTQNTRLTALESDQTMNEAIFSSNAGRLDALETADIALDARLDTTEVNIGIIETWKSATITFLASLKTIATTAFTALVGKTTPIGTDVIAIQEADGTYKKVSITDLQATIASIPEVTQVEHDALATRVTTAESDIDALQAADVALDTRVDALEAGGGGGITTLTGDVTASGTGSVIATIPNNIITNSKLADNSVSSTKLSASSVTNAKLGAQAVDSTKIADDAVTTSKINTFAVTTTKLADDSVSNAKLQDGSVSDTKLASNSVTTAKLNADAVTTAKITDANVTLPKIAAIADQTILGNTSGVSGSPSALTTTQVNTMLPTMVGDSGAGGSKGLVPAPAAGTSADGKFLKADGTWAVPPGTGGGGGGITALTGDVTASGSGSVATTIANDAITNAKIGAAAVSASKIFDGSVITSKIQDGNVTDVKLASNAVTTIKILDSAVTTGKINNEAVTTAKIQGQAVTEAKLAVDAVTSFKIANFAVTNNKLGTSSVSLDKVANIAANSLLGNNTGAAAAPLELTATQATSMLNNVVGDSGAGGTKGLVPAPEAGDAAAAKFLKADGTWATPAGGGGGGTLQDAYTSSSNGDIIVTDTTGKGVSIKDSATNTNRTNIFEVLQTGGTQVFGVTKDGVVGNFMAEYALTASAVSSGFEFLNIFCTVTKLNGFIILEGSFGERRISGTNTGRTITLSLPVPVTAGTNAGYGVIHPVDDNWFGTAPTEMYFQPIASGATTAVITLTGNPSSNATNYKYYAFRYVYKA